MSCLVECLELGPPPDSILFLPPPPIPLFLQGGQQHPDLMTNGTPCASPQLCQNWVPPNRVPPENDFVELYRKDVENWSMGGIDDTWLLVLVASSIGVLLLGALLAMFLLKCREMNMFGHADCSANHRPIKTRGEPRLDASIDNLNANKLVHPSETVLYHHHHHHNHHHGSAAGAFSPSTDNRAVWAALTPRGTTQHYVSESFPRDLMLDYDADAHYETVDAAENDEYPCRKSNTFENSGFFDYDYEYEDPTPLIQGYRQAADGPDGPFNADARCAPFAGTLRRGGASLRPEVSSPTRIENPNLPPLNLYPPPHKAAAGTLKKTAAAAAAAEVYCRDGGGYGKVVAYGHKYGGC